MSEIEAFESFLSSQTVTQCVQKFHYLCDLIGVDPNGQQFPVFFSQIKKCLLNKPTVNYNFNSTNQRQHRVHNNNWKAASIIHKLHHRFVQTNCC